MKETSCLRLARCLTVVFATLVATVAFASSPGKPWVVAYTDKVTVSDLSGYDPIVLDSKYHPPLQPLRDRGKTVLGYISMGEVEDHRSHFEAVKAEGILLNENPDWKGSYFVDVRDPRWITRVIEELIPALLRAGFNGIFLDTLDNPIYTEEQNPEKFAGMTKAAINMIKAIRLHYPDIKIMVNRAYKILPDVADDINFVLGESVMNQYDFSAKRYVAVGKKDYEEQVALLNLLKKNHPALRIMTLDYADPKDTSTISKIYAQERQNGFEPYVSVIGLDRLVKEP